MGANSPRDVALTLPACAVSFPPKSFLLHEYPSESIVLMNALHWESEASRTADQTLSDGGPSIRESPLSLYGRAAADLQLE
jgi:hypothetical protein